VEELNMDFFGIGNAIRAATDMYIFTSRRTGRTLSMVNSLKSGDRVVFTNSQEANRVRRLCEERGIQDVHFEVCDPHNVRDMFNRGTSQGRTIFDHSWVEAYYIQVIEQAVKDIDSLEVNLSGRGEEHIKTKLAAQEYSKFMYYLNK
jgi:hypothetical protein